MKSFAVFALFAASVASAQTTTAGGEVNYNSSTGVFTCTGNPNGAYCADNSLQSNIIIRCTNGIGQPGNCNDNLSGEFPGGLSYAPCWETSATSGDAACSKNCVVYGASGNYNGTFTLPDCTPISSSSSSASSTSTSSASSASQYTTTTEPFSSTTSSLSGTSVSSSTTATITTISKIGSTTQTFTYTTTYCPSSTLSSVTLSTGIGSGSTGSPAPPSNGTLSTGGAGGASSAGSTPTATPVGPTKSASETSPTFTGAAIANHAGSALAAVGLVVAYFL